MEVKVMVVVGGMAVGSQTVQLKEASSGGWEIGGRN